uniref:THAP domain-containing protein 1 n=1 Tax=Amphiprion ocellaris TaxID=80972 RepID=A0A3Q1BHM0_AMPOC
MLTGCFPCSLRVTPHNSLLQPRINNQVTPPRCRGGAASLDVKATTRPSTWGSFFHGLPTRDPQRCRTWLKAIQNPRFDENTPVSKYSGVRVCSLHFTAEDYEEDFRGKILNIAPKPMLKSGAVPSVFPGRHSGALGRTDTSAPAPKRRKIPASVSATGSSPQPPPAAGSEESFCIVVSVDPLDNSFHSEPEFSSLMASDEDANKDCTVVHSCSLMELFRRCQTCGKPIAGKEVFHSGVQMRVKWSCHGGHASDRGPSELLD